MIEAPSKVWSLEEVLARVEVFDELDVLCLEQALKGTTRDEDSQLTTRWVDVEGGLLGQVLNEYSTSVLKVRDFVEDEFGAGDWLDVIKDALMASLMTEPSHQQAKENLFARWVQAMWVADRIRVATPDTVRSFKSLASGTTLTPLQAFETLPDIFQPTQLTVR
jgi:hypothetical protein